MLILGKLYLNHGHAAQASEWFKKSTEHAPTTLDQAIAWQNLGYSREDEGNSKEALDAVEHSLNLGEASLKGDLLLSKARILETENNTAQAKTTYDQIMGQLPNSEYSKLAELYKARLK
jgi:tetratricopeptide (TPR) repeat protein